MFDLVWVRIFPQTSGVRTFSPTYNGVRFFFQHYMPWAIFSFSAGYFLSRYLIARFFPLKISLGDIFSEMIHYILKSQMVGP